MWESYGKCSKQNKKFHHSETVSTYKEVLTNGSNVFLIHNVQLKY